MALHELFAGELFALCTACSSADQPEHGCNHASRFLLRPLGVRPAKASRAEISASALLPQPPLRWPCVSWSVDTSQRRLACLTDRSACVVEPRTCDWHTKCSRLTVRSQFPSWAPSWGLCAAQFWHRPLTHSEGIFLDDLFLSSHIQQGPSATRCHSFLLWICCRTLCTVFVFLHELNLHTLGICLMTSQPRSREP